MTAEDDKADLGNVRLIGRWHDPVSFTGVDIAEASSAQDISSWILN